MQVTLYTNNDDRRKINKSISGGVTVNVTLKDSQDLDEPIITLAYNTSYLSYNYVYIPAFSSYYFITDVDVVTGQEINLKLSVDPLMTIKNDILGSQAHIVRSSGGSRYIVDPFAKKQENITVTSQDLGIIAPDGDYYIFIKGGKD